MRVLCSFWNVERHAVNAPQIVAVHVGSPRTEKKHRPGDARRCQETDRRRAQSVGKRSVAPLSWIQRLGWRKLFRGVHTARSISKPTIQIHSNTLTHRLSQIQIHSLTQLHTLTNCWVSEERGWRLCGVPCLATPRSTRNGLRDPTARGTIGTYVFGVHSYVDVKVWDGLVSFLWTCLWLYESRVKKQHEFRQPQETSWGRAMPEDLQLTVPAPVCLLKWRSILTNWEKWGTMLIYIYMYVERFVTYVIFWTNAKYTYIEIVPRTTPQRNKWQSAHARWKQVESPLLHSKINALIIADSIWFMLLLFATWKQRGKKCGKLWTMRPSLAGCGWQSEVFRFSLVLNLFSLILNLFSLEFLCELRTLGCKHPAAR